VTQCGRDSTKGLLGKISAYLLAELLLFALIFTLSEWLRGFCFRSLAFDPRAISSAVFRPASLATRASSRPRGTIGLPCNL